ncbi:MAG: dihydrolipoamide acetyltransferase family protein [Ignavibacteriales bacterium]
MKVNVLMPKMGESITEGTVIKWHKSKGDFVAKDEIIFEISTDKVDTEIPSPAAGILADIKVFENETALVDTLVAVIETEIDAYEKTVDEVKVRQNEIPSTAQVGGELVEIVMPKMGESIVEGTIIKWNKNINDKVSKDEILFEISTDKVDTEVPSPVEGILDKIFVKENETAEVGKVVAIIKTTSGIVVNNSESKLIVNDEKIQTSGIKSPINHIINQKEKPLSNKFFSPLVLNISQKEGVDFSELEKIKGTGINGRVTKNDLLSYIKNRNNISEEKTEFSAEVTIGKPSSSNDKFDIIPMDRIRERIVHHMIESRDTSVHVTAVTEVDMTIIHNFITRHKEQFQSQHGIKLTYMAFISFATIRALKEFPLLNASIDGKNIVVKKFINLGIAVAVEPNGLIVPNIKNAEQLSVLKLAKSISEIGEKARTKKLTADDITNGTFSITNYGVFGSLFGTPIINQPEVGILGVGAVVKKPVVIEQQGVESIAIKPMMYLSLSHDHRLVDGMLGGKFLMSVKKTLENFDIEKIN